MPVLELTSHFYHLRVVEALVLKLLLANSFSKTDHSILA
jgi:hypothetical protein